MLISLVLPLLFSALAGAYGYFKVPEKAGQVLLVMVLFQVVGGAGYVMSATPELFTLLGLHAAVVASLMVRHANRRAVHAEV